jgi:hypothetical protein
MDHVITFSLPLNARPQPALDVDPTYPALREREDELPWVVRIG